jgi:hypothetical protein
MKESTCNEIILKIKGKTYRTPLVKSEDNPA